jgi:hypothetical protein
VRYSSEVRHLRMDATRILAGTPGFVDLNDPVARAWDERCPPPHSRPVSSARN